MFLRILGVSSVTVFLLSSIHLKKQHKVLMAVGKKLFIVLGLGLSQEEKHHVYIKFPSFTKYVTMDHGSVKNTHNRYNRTKLWIFMTSSTVSGVLKLSCLSSLVEETAPGQAEHIDDSTNLWRMICPERLQQQDRHQRLKWPGNLSINVWWFGILKLKNNYKHSLILDHTFEKQLNECPQNSSKLTETFVNNIYIKPTWNLRNITGSCDFKGADVHYPIWHLKWVYIFFVFRCAFLVNLFTNLSGYRSTFPCREVPVRILTWETWLPSKISALIPSTF